MATNVNTEITRTFWIHGEDGQDYKVDQYTEFHETNIRGNVHREIGRVYWITDGGDSVSQVAQNGEKKFYIPNLGVFAEFLKDDNNHQAAKPQVPAPFYGFNQK